MPESTPVPGVSSAEALFAEWIAQRRSASPGAFEELCRDHPQQASLLRAMHAGWNALEPVLDALGAVPGPPAAVSELQSRLARRAPPDERYQVECEIGRGGMGLVLRVWDRDLERSLAMKLALGTEPRALARFLGEARVTGGLDHPGIVPIHEIGQDAEGRLYFTMRLVEGLELGAVFELARHGTEGWTKTRALGAVAKVCEALAFAHSRGVIHRDLKPSNVMVGRFGEVYVVDWGLARVLGVSSADIGSASETARGSPGRTLDGDVLGTAAYMSPEQARGDLAAIGPHSDVYSIGAILYHLLAGHAPYLEPGARTDPRAVWARVQEAPPAPVRRLAAGEPAELIAICEKAMERDPERRYRDVQELSEDLRAFLENRVVRAHATGALAEFRKWVRRNPGMAASIAAAVLIALGGLGSTAYVQARERRLADEQREIAKRRAEDVLRLSAMQDLDDLVREADALWPVSPALLPRYEDWTKRARELLAGSPTRLGLDDHRRKLMELGAVDEPAATSTEHRWWRAQLERLIADLAAFGDAEKGPIDGLSPEHGWGVARRLELARTLDERTLSGPEAARRWREAIAAIGDPKECPLYGGLAIEPELGLLPIGSDPGSSLWEFADLQTGEVPERDAGGELVFGERSGLVFVLIPGGTLRMGAQAADPALPSHDPQADPGESPVNEVELGPFFLSKHEMTQAQWLRCTGVNPSAYAAPHRVASITVSLLHPVEQVSWDQCRLLLDRLGLDFPTEAQWEHAARAGTQTAWWTGDDPRSLEGAANLADSSWQKSGGSAHWLLEEWLDDGFPIHAPVGTYRPNGFGLHDVCGNVLEWIREPFASYRVPARTGDGERRGESAVNRLVRSGSWSDVASLCRSASRQYAEPRFAADNLGLRPARPLKAAR